MARRKTYELDPTALWEDNSLGKRSLSDEGLKRAEFSLIELLDDKQNIYRGVWLENKKPVMDPEQLRSHLDTVKKDLDNLPSSADPKRASGLKGLLKKAYELLDRAKVKGDQGVGYDRDTLVEVNKYLVTLEGQVEDLVIREPHAKITSTQRTGPVASEHGKKSAEVRREKRAEKIKEAQAVWEKKYAYAEEARRISDPITHADKAVVSAFDVGIRTVRNWRKKGKWDKTLREFIGKKVIKNA